MQVDNTPPLKPTRSSFIRGLPVTMPVDEVIERGREIGLSIQPSDVHSARYYMRQAAAATANPSSVGARLWLRADATARPAESPASTAPPKAVVAVEKRAEVVPEQRRRKGRRIAERTPGEVEATIDQLRALVLRLGSERTHAIIDELENMAASLARRSKTSRRSR